MAEYDEIKSGLNAISSEITKARSLFARARAIMVDAEAILAAMPGKWSSLGSEINAAATANPNDDNYQLAKGEKDKLAANFQGLKTYASALIAAHDGVTE